jgi:hypothetical protein
MSIFTGISTAWSTFEGWVAKVTPGLKTEVIAAAGLLGNVAALGQQYLTNLPTNDFITPSKLTAVNAGLFTLAFWLRNIGSRTAGPTPVAPPVAVAP